MKFTGNTEGGVIGGAAADAVVRDLCETKKALDALLLAVVDQKRAMIESLQAIQRAVEENTRVLQDSCHHMCEAIEEARAAREESGKLRECMKSNDRQNQPEPRPR